MYSKENCHLLFLSPYTSFFYEEESQRYYLYNSLFQTHAAIKCQSKVFDCLRKGVNYDELLDLIDNDSIIKLIQLGAIE